MNGPARSAALDQSDQWKPISPSGSITLGTNADDSEVSEVKAQRLAP